MLAVCSWVLALAQEGERPEAADLFRAGLSAPRPQAVEPSARYNVSQPKHIDRRTVSDLAVGAMDLAHLGLRDDGGDPWAARILKWTVSAWFGVACTHVAHEYGHLSSLSRCGCTRAVVGSVGTPMDEREDATPARLFAQGLLPKGSSLSLSSDDWEDLQRRFEGRPEAYNRFWLSVEAGGLNQEQALASRYATRLHEGKLSYLDTPSFLWAASGTIFYPSSSEESDIADYIGHLKIEGREVSASRLKALSALRFLGGTGIASCRGALRGILGHDGGGFVEAVSADPFDDLRVYWPEFESYLTLSGPTLRASLPLQAGEWFVTPSYERSFATGGVDHEGGLRARAPFFDGLLWLEAAMYASDQGGVWRSGEAELRPLAWASILIGVDAGRGYTFRRDILGAREEFLEGSEHSLVLGFRVTLAF